MVSGATRPAPYAKRYVAKTTMKPQDIIKSIINNSVAKVACEEGFKRSNYNFFRRKGSTVQVLNIQLSRWNHGNEASFYVNASLAFDELRKFEDRAIEESPKYYGCDFYHRLEHYVPDTPPIWNVKLDMNIEPMVKSLNKKIYVLINNFNRIESLHDFLDIALKEDWFAFPGEYDLLARFQDSLGNTEKAEEARTLFNEFLLLRDTMSREDLLKHFGVEF